jgi:hypothetical protein
MRGPELRTPWTPLPALAVTALIAAAGLLAGQVLVGAVLALPTDTLPQRALPREAVQVLFLIGMQATVILAVLAAAGVRGADPARVLGLAPVRIGLRGALTALAGALMLIGTYNGLVHLSGLADITADLGPFVTLLRSPYWVGAVIAIALGAPLSEELLFRGFLLPALARSRLGFNGAAATTTLAWTALHVGYSASGLIEVLLMGAYFSWLLGRTGSLRAPLLCHIAVNATILAALALWWPS